MDAIQRELASFLAPAAGMPEADAEKLLEIPADTAYGDYAFPCFSLAKALRKAPPAIAAGIAAKQAEDVFEVRNNIKKPIFIGREHRFSSVVSAQ
ncbi:MAG: hypothetical protein V1809_10140 [Planctomycetota bacterium]